MKIFSDIKNSIYAPSFYRGLENKPFSFSIKYFFKYALLLAAITTIINSIIYIPEINLFLKGIGSVLSDQYPDELIIKVDKGNVSVNVEEPYFVSFPDEFSAGSILKPGNPDGIKYLFAIDTQNELSLELFKRHNSLFLLGKNSIAFYDNNSISIQPFPENLNTEIDKKTADGWSETLRSLTGVASYTLFPILLFVFGYFSFISKLIYLIFGALLIWLLSSILGYGLNYSKSYRIGIHAMTLGLILFPILGYLFGKEIRFGFTLVMLIIFLINLQPNYTEKQLRTEVAIES